MSRYTESKIAIEAVKVVEEYGEISMSDLIDILEERMRPFDHDMEIIKSRKDTYFSQKVRNLRSHNNKIFFHNVYYDVDKDKYISYECKNLKGKLEETVYLQKLVQKKKKTENFYARMIDYELVNRERKLIGDKGEELVYKNQIEFVKKYVPGYVRNVRHVSKLDGDGAGYDISSFNKKKMLVYIEVKSTTRKKETPFYMSASEYAFYELHKNNYIIARVYEFNLKTNKGKIEYICGSEFEGIFEKEVSAYKIFTKNNRW